MALNVTIVSAGDGLPIADLEFPKPIMAAKFLIKYLGADRFKIGKHVWLREPIIEGGLVGVITMYHI